MTKPFKDEDFEYMLKKIFYASGALRVKQYDEVEGHLDDILDKYKDQLTECLQQ